MNPGTTKSLAQNTNAEMDQAMLENLIFALGDASYADDWESYKKLENFTGWKIDAPVSRAIFDTLNDVFDLMNPDSNISGVR